MIRKNPAPDQVTPPQIAATSLQPGISRNARTIAPASWPFFAPRGTRKSTTGQEGTSDSFAAMFGSLIGTSTTTSYIEGAAGVAAGGRTGLTAVFVANCSS